MKTTVKEYQEKSELRGQLRRELRETAINAPRYEELEAMIQDLKVNYFDKLETVNVSFMCGSRVFYREVIKIGKTLFDYKDKMTKSNGYYCIEVISEITEKMKNDMISDSYYY